MTPYGMARAECANLEPDGGCLGVQAADLGRHAGPLRPLARCLLADKKRCEYFEQIVLPLASSHPKYVSPAQLYGQIGRTSVQVSRRTCKDCGAPIAKRQRYCGTCRQKRQRLRGRERVRTFRQRRMA